MRARDGGSGDGCETASVTKWKQKWTTGIGDSLTPDSRDKEESNIPLVLGG